MRTFLISALAIGICSQFVIAGSGNEEKYATPQSLDSIGSMIQDSNHEHNAKEAATEANCKAKLAELKDRMTGLRILLESTEIKVLRPVTDASAVSEHNYAKALGEIEQRVRTVAAERQQLKDALLRFRKSLDAHQRNGHHQNLHEAVFEDISALLIQVDASFADYP